MLITLHNICLEELNGPYLYICNIIHDENKQFMNDTVHNFITP